MKPASRRSVSGSLIAAIAPYGVFPTRDGNGVLIGIQNDREWRVLAEKVLGDAALAADPDFATNLARVQRRAETDGKVAAVSSVLDADALMQKLAAADIAFARVNDVAGARAPSASAAHHGRHAERPRFLSGASGAARIGVAPLRSRAGARRAYREGAGGIRCRAALDAVIEGEM